MKSILILVGLGAFAGLCPAAPAQRIPEVNARSLANTSVNLPADLNGRIGILVLGFSKQASSQTKTWGESIARDFGSDTHVAYYEMPVLADVPALFRGMIVDSIRKQLPEGERSHFVPILKDSASWKSLASFNANDDAYIVVTDAQGRSQWHVHGPMQTDLYNEMKLRIKALESSASGRPAPPI